MRQLLPPTEWLPIRIAQDNAVIAESPTTAELAALVAHVGTKGPEQLMLTRLPPVAGEYFTVQRDTPQGTYRVTYCHGGEEDHWFTDTDSYDRAYRLALGWSRAQADWSVGEHWALALLASVGQPPMTVRMNPDDGPLRHLGTLPDGRQFLVTVPGPVDLGRQRRQFVARYIFDAEGRHLSATIVQIDVEPAADGDLAGELAGADPDLDSIAAVNADRVAEALRAELGPCQREPIEIMPFTINHDGIEFGVESRPSEGEEWIVVALPGEYLRFGPPWDGNQQSSDRQ